MNGGIPQSVTHITPTVRELLAAAEAFRATLAAESRARIELEAALCAARRDGLSQGDAMNICRWSRETVRSAERRGGLRGRD